jgi:hypothetical protein
MFKQHRFMASILLWILVGVSIPPRAAFGQTPESGSGTSLTALAKPVKVSGKQFPAIDIPGEDPNERNLDKVPLVPEGPKRGTLSPEVKATSLLKLTSDPDEARGAAGGENPVIFGTDTPFGKQVTFSGIPPDMSGAVSDNIVFLTGNTFAALSTDGGNSFTALNPTTIFPSGATRDAFGNLLDRGLCCDQVIQYVPKFRRFIWLMQFCGTGSNCLLGINKLRIAAASPEDILASGGTAWTYWDLPSGLFGLTSTTFDYPDMSVGNNSLYVSADAVSIGLMVMRIPLSEIATSSTINIGFTNPSVPAGSLLGRGYGGHISQNTGDTVYWAGHISNSQMRVFNWQEGSGTYFWRSIDINSWPNTNYTSNCPDGTDWLNFLSGFPGSAVIGATRRFDPREGGRSEVTFAWTAGRGGGFPHPHIQVVRLDTSTWNVIQQWQVWNPDFAFAYPCLATNSNQEVGVSLGWGGNLVFASHAVGIFGDFVVWYSELSKAALNRWGDFVTVRQASERTKLYGAVGYAVQQSTPVAVFNPRYILFGRASDM